MTAPRFRIYWLMGCIALVALNFGVMRLLDDLGHRVIALTPHTDRFYRVTQLWVVGGLPMLNALGMSDSALALCSDVGDPRLARSPGCTALFSM